jgi:hypothetical protein
MAPVAVQSLWSFRQALAREEGHSATFNSSEARQAAVKANLNTCHVWAEGSEHLNEMLHATERSVPLWITKRYRELGRDPSAWRAG